jgi:hypothetical protein
MFMPGQQKFDVEKHAAIKTRLRWRRKNSVIYETITPVD